MGRRRAVNAIAPGYIRTNTDEVMKNIDVVNNEWAKAAVQNRIGSVDNWWAPRSISPPMPRTTVKSSSSWWLTLR